MVSVLLLSLGPALADPAISACAGPLELRTFDVPLTTYGAGVAVTSHATSWTVTDAEHHALDTLALASRLGDEGTEQELARRQAKARKTGWIVTGVSIPATLLGALALNSSVNGDGGDGALVAGATGVSLGGVGLMFGPIWLGVRPRALKNNPAAFYPLDMVQDKIGIYHDACGY